VDENVPGGLEPNRGYVRSSESSPMKEIYFSKSAMGTRKKRYLRIA
jgi:hypothetical protein